MNKKIFLPILVTVLITYSCQKKYNEREEHHVKSVEFTNKCYPLDSIPISIKYIFLEDSDESIFRDVHKALIYKDKIIILDIIGKQVLIFGEDGSFIRKIGRVGQGPEEYITPSDIDIDKNGNIVIHNGPKKELLVFSMENTFIKKLPLPFQVENIATLNNGNFLFSLTKYNTGKCKDFKFAVTDSVLNITKQFLKYEDYHDENYVLESFMQKTNEKISYYKPIDDAIYIFNDEGIYQKLQLDFGKKRVPDELKKNMSDFMKKHADAYEFLISTPFFVGKYLTGVILKHNYLNFFIYDTEEHEMYEEYESHIIPISYVNDSTFLSIINASVFPNYALDESLPEQHKKHIDRGGTIFCFYTIQ